jgi:hypothetical protein
VIGFEIFGEGGSAFGGAAIARDDDGGRVFTRVVELDFGCIEWMDVRGKEESDREENPGRCHVERKGAGPSGTEFLEMRRCKSDVDIEREYSEMVARHNAGLGRKFRLQSVSVKHDKFLFFFAATLKLFYVVNTMNRCELNELLAIYMQLVPCVVVKL